MAAGRCAEGPRIATTTTRRHHAYHCEENGRMARVRMQRLIEVESRCFCCDRFGMVFQRTSRPDRSLSVSVLILNE